MMGIKGGDKGFCLFAEKGVCRMESFRFGEQKATSLRHENTDNICEANFQVQNLSRAADFAKRKYLSK